MPQGVDERVDPDVSIAEITSNVSSDINYISRIIFLAAEFSWLTIKLSITVPYTNTLFDSFPFQV